MARYPEPELGRRKGDRDDTPELASQLSDPIAAERRVSYYVALVDHLNRVEARLSPSFDMEQYAISALDDVRSRGEPRASIVIEVLSRMVRRVRP